MSKRINLFRAKKQAINIQYLLERIKTLSIVIGLLLFVFFVILNIIIFQKGVQFRQLEREKADSLKFLLQNKDIEAKLRYFKEKQKQLDSYYKDDAHFLPYYKVLNDALSYATNSPMLETVTIDKLHTTNFIINFNDLGSAIQFLKYVESDSFLAYFNNLSLVSFNLLDDPARLESKGYQFVFEGAYKEIKNDSL